jgi:hypothetical protein
MKIFKLLLICFILFSCSKKTELKSLLFLSVTAKAELNESIKSNFGDTIFVEKKYVDSVKYYFSTLTKSQKNHFEILMESLEKERADKSFSLSEGEQVFLIISNGTKIYKKDNQLKEKLNIFFQELNYVEIDTIYNFWNIKGIVQTPYPPRKNTKLIFKSNGH